MVVCPCGVMVPSAGVGRTRRGPRPPSCFDTSSATVTTQPKDTEEPASVEKLTAASNEQSGLSIQFSRTNKNKGALGKPSDDNKSEHSSRTTLALATTESGRYVGTRPLRSNRSPTPTLHKIPLRTTTNQKNTSSGRPSKHLPAVRTSPTSPQDKQAVNKATRDSNRVRGPPIALPRNNIVNHRINDMNSSNQRRLLKQNLSPEETQLRSTTRATLPATKPFPRHHPDPMTQHTRVYENLPHTWRTPDHIIYENLRPQHRSDASGGPPGGVDVTESEMDPATPEPPWDSQDTPEPPWDSQDTTVWLSDSWKYNTIKRAPDFNIFEFSNIDSKEDTERGNKYGHQSHQVKDNLRKFRSRLPTFGRKKDKENKGKQESTMKTPPGYGRRGKDDNQKAYKSPEGRRESPVSIHKGRTSRPPLSPTVINGEGARSKDPSPCSSDSENKASRSSLRSAREVSRNQLRHQLERLSRWSGSESSVSTDSSSCVSPLISPSPSLRSFQLQHRDGGSPLPSPSRPRPHIYPENREEGPPPLCLFRRDSSLEKRSLGSLEKLPRLDEQRKEGCGPGRPSRHAYLHHPTGDGRRRSGAAPYPGPEPGGHRSPQVEGTLSPPPPPPPRHRQPQASLPHQTHLQDPRQTHQEGLSHSGRPAGEATGQRQGPPQLPAASYWIPRPAASPAPQRHLSTVGSRPNTPSQMPSAAHRPSKMPTAAHRQETPSKIPPAAHRQETPSQVPPAAHRQETHSQLPTAAHRQETPSQVTPAAHRQETPCKIPPAAHRQETPSQVPTANHKQGTPRQMPTAGHKQKIPSRIPSVGHRQETPSQTPTPGHRQGISSRIPTAGLMQDTSSQKPTAGFDQETLQQIPTAGPKQGTCSQLSSTKPKQEAYSQLPIIGSRQETRSQLQNVCPEQNPCSQVLNIRSRQEISSRVPTVSPEQETSSEVPVISPKQEILSQGLTVDPEEETLSQVPNVELEEEERLEMGNVGFKQETCRELPIACPRQRTCPQLSSTDDRQDMSEDGSEGREAGTSRCSGGTRNSATSPSLPPLPQELLDETQTNSPEDTGGGDVTSRRSSVASICILSLDLTVDCEELSENGFSVVNVIENEHFNLDLTENETEEESKSKENMSYCSPDNDNLESIDISSRNTGNGSRSLSASSSSVRFDEKYYEKDDYDFQEESVGDKTEEEEEEGTLDAGIPSMLHCQSDDALHKRMNDTTATKDDDDDDFIDIDCDVKPMETLKRPLVYGYGRSPIRTFRGTSLMDKRLSQAADVSDYMEMCLLQSVLNGDYNPGVQHSESCIDLQETYWDHWQAKINAEERHMNKTRNNENPLSNPLSKFPKCPSSKFSYDPEVLLAQVKCPKSLEDATFKQYSAYVKSHIYDRVGNVYEGLKEYGLTHGQPDWISSQPELPDLPKEYRESDMEYSSEPELSNTRKRRQPWAMPAQCHPHRGPPPSLSNKEASLDSGTWTYFPSSEESTVAPSPHTYYPEPLPRSASSLSHVRAGLYNPWHHLLPDVTPPRTPRHSVYYNTGAGSGFSSPSGSRPVSPSPSHCSLTSRPSAAEPHAPPDKKRKAATSVAAAPSPPHTPSKRSFLPSLSMVMRSPLKKQNVKNPKEGVRKGATATTPINHGQDKPAPHESIKNRRLTNISSNSSSSSKSSSSSSSSSSASSKDSVKTVIAAPQRSKGALWLMKHFGSSKSSMAAV